MGFAILEIGCEELPLRMPKIHCLLQKEGAMRTRRLKYSRRPRIIQKMQMILEKMGRKAYEPVMPRPPRLSPVLLIMQLMMLRDVRGS